MEDQKCRATPIYVECEANVTMIGEKWTIRLKLPKMLYDAMMLEEKEGKKTATFPVKVILEPAKMKCEYPPCDKIATMVLIDPKGEEDMYGCEEHYQEMQPLREEDVEAGWGWKEI